MVSLGAYCKADDIPVMIFLANLISLFHSGYWNLPYSSYIYNTITKHKDASISSWQFRWAYRASFKVHQWLFMGMEILFANLDGRNAFLKNSNFDPYSRDKNINKMVILGSTEMRIPFPYSAFTYQSSIFQYLYASLMDINLMKNKRKLPLLRTLTLACLRWHFDL